MDRRKIHISLSTCTNRTKPELAFHLVEIIIRDQWIAAHVRRDHVHRALHPLSRV